MALDSPAHNSWLLFYTHNESHAKALFLTEYYITGISMYDRYDTLRLFSTSCGKLLALQFLNTLEVEHNLQW